jgi:hypothetical protein
LYYTPSPYVKSHDSPPQWFEVAPASRRRFAHDQNRKIAGETPAPPIGMAEMNRYFSIAVQKHRSDARANELAASVTMDICLLKESGWTPMC